MWSEVPLGDELRAEFGPPRRVQRLRSSPRSRVWLIERTVRGELADVCAGWLIRGDALVARAHRGKIDHLARIPQDWTWGTATARERLLHRLAVVAQSSIDRPELLEFGRCCSFLRDRMLARWPALQSLPVRRPSSRGNFIASESGSQA
jgi:hypothetical protein